MTLQEVMTQRRFAVVGNTLDEEKFAWKIKNAMLDHGYEVYAVGKELASLNDIPGEIDVIDLCIHPAKGLKLMQECRKEFKTVVLQPGASDDALVQYMEDNHIPYLNGCLLVGLREYVDKTE